MKQKKIFITGLTGSGGSYLYEYLINNIKNIQIFGINRGRDIYTNDMANLYNKAKIYQCDLLDLSSTLTVLKKIKPDYIFHLASNANVRASFDYPSVILQNNIISTVNLFESIKILKLNPVIQLCSTSEVYGKVNKKDVPIDEKNTIRPASPYAVSKTTQDLLADVYYSSYGLKIIKTRMFTYINPRRTDLFASSFARQIARIENGLQSKLYHGNLNSVRTILDVRDAMRAYWLAITRCKYGEVYNIGGSNVLSVGNFLKKLIKKSKVKINTELNVNLLRPNDVTLQIPDSSKFIKQSKWGELYSIDDSIDLLLSYWRNQITNKKN